jgi:hypothetical protein
MLHLLARKYCSKLKNMPRPMSHVDENMADFLHRMQSEAHCDRDTAAARKEGLDKRVVERNVVDNTKRREKKGRTNNL